MRFRGVALAGVLAAALVGCSVEPATNATAEAEAVTAGPSLPTPKFAEIAQDTYAMTFDAKMPRPAVEAAARTHCAGKQWCKVMGWDDPARAATAMPMTDRETEAIKVNYTVNRASGMDEATWS